MSIETSLPDWLTRCAENFPQRIAVQDATTRWSFARLEQQVRRLAGQLAAAGVGSGSRVALLANNGLPYIACVHALSYLGAILVPLNTRLTADELSWQLEDVRAVLLLTDRAQESRAMEPGQRLPALAQGLLVFEAESGEVGLAGGSEVELAARTEIDLAATQAIMYTSGTSGRPKGVLITYGMHWWNAVGSALNLGNQADDCWLACLPLFHIGGLAILMRGVIYGIRVLVQERFEVESVDRLLREEGVTMISVVATMLQRLLARLEAEGGEEARYPAALRCVLLGGGPAPQALLEASARHALPISLSYGLTEACSQAVTLAPGDALRKPGSAGRPLLPVQLRILNDDQPVQPGEAGMIYLKGPTITPGYADRPAETRAVLQDGWLATGDLGYLDAEGYLYVLARRNDLIISGGENIYPAEIESVLMSHPDIEEAGVCGQADPEWGEVPLAFVQVRPGRTVEAESLLAYARQRLARYKLPRALYIVESLPHNSMGKLLRRELPGLLAG